MYNELSISFLEPTKYLISTIRKVVDVADIATRGGEVMVLSHLFCVLLNLMKYMNYENKHMHIFIQELAYDIYVFLILAF